MSKIKLLLLTLIICSSCLNEDGNCAGEPTYAEILDRAKVPHWRKRCSGRGSMYLSEVVQRVPPDGEVLDVISCDSILVRIRGRCYIITQGFRSHSWSQADCP